MQKEKLYSAVKQYGTPLYVYDAEVIRQKKRELQSAFEDFENTEFLYAIKANFNPHILNLILEAGCGVDAVSVEEVKIALKQNCPTEKIMYTENNMSDQEMLEAQELGVLINFNSLERLEKFGAKFPGSKVCIRFNPNVGAASHSTNITGGPGSKFGISQEHLPQIIQILKKHSLNLIGIHQHIGSGWLQEKEPLIAMDTMLKIAEEIFETDAGESLEFIDCGGGFGVPYKDDESPLDLSSLGKKLCQKLNDFCAKHSRQLKLRFEPGRYLVAESGQLITQVTAVKKESDGRTYLGLDTGMNHLARVAMYGSYHPIENLNSEADQTEKYDICGNICECADFFAKDRELPISQTGDLIIIGIAGAYGSAMANNYQFRPQPAEVLVDGEEIKLIRKRLSFDQLYDGWGF